MLTEGLLKFVIYIVQISGMSEVQFLKILSLDLFRVRLKSTILTINAISIFSIYQHFFYVLNVFLKSFFLVLSYWGSLAISFCFYCGLSGIVNMYLEDSIFLDGLFILFIGETSTGHGLIMSQLTLRTESFSTHEAIQNFVTHLVKAIFRVRFSFFV